MVYLITNVNNMVQYLSCLVIYTHFSQSKINVNVQLKEHKFQWTLSIILLSNKFHVRGDVGFVKKKCQYDQNIETKLNT